MICTQLRSRLIHSVHKRSRIFIHGNFAFFARICASLISLTAVTFFRCPTVSELELTWNVPVTAPQRNPTLPWPDFHFRNRSLGGHFPKSAFALGQFRINICIFFSILKDCSNKALANIYWLLGMKRLHFSVRACGKVLLLVAWVWFVLPSTASSGGMLPLELWCQASPLGLIRRPLLVNSVLCSGWSS